jgi:hypothetical protein
LLLGIPRELLAQRELDDRLFPATSKEDHSAAKE